MRCYHKVASNTINTENFENSNTINTFCETILIFGSYCRDKRGWRESILIQEKDLLLVSYECGVLHLSNLNLN